MTGSAKFEDGFDAPAEWVWCAQCEAQVPKAHAKIAHPTPGILRWRTRRWWAWIVGRMYVLGIISGSIASGHPDGWITHGLSLRGSRPYILGMRGFTWGRVPLWHRLRRGHWPTTVWLGMCGVCVPWPCCGATGYDHAEGCDGA